jgi:predicted O-linked N-acetylglucosamine transferase (SPINDLY family)
MPGFLPGRLGQWFGRQKLLQAQRLVGAGRLDEAGRLAQEIVDAEPDNADALHVLGLVAIRRRDGQRAIELISRAIALTPRRAEFHASLGLTWYGFGNLPEATRCLRAARALAPDDAGVLNNLGICLKDAAAYSEAVECFRHAIARGPRNFAAHINLGNALTGQGELDAAVESLRQAIALLPEFANAWSNLLVVLNYLPAISPQEIYRESLEFEKRCAARLLTAPVFANAPDPARALRIGYVSPDFREHSVAHFTADLLGAHDRDRFTVFAYADVGRPDERTRVFQAQADEWRSIAGVSDDDVAAAIRADGIDVLVDLAGHTAGNRLPVFARRPAPVQVTWLGYPNTTGMQAMDYRLTDEIADPPGEADALHTERLVRLPGGFLCYQTGDASAVVAPLPALAQGQVTFGSFNALPKTTPVVIRTWAEILKAVPGSRLVLKSQALADEPTRARVLQAFREQGVDPARVELLGWVPGRAAHLEFYGRLDIALDPFPYNGTTTTCEALWMGVPVVTLRGDRHAGRVGASLLQRIGLDEWIAGSREDYVALAHTVAADHQRLAALRASLRSRVQRAGLTDVRGFTRSLEDSYREMWQAWCKGPAGSSPKPA